jgi:hypothetical protein
MWIRVAPQSSQSSILLDTARRHCLYQYCSCTGPARSLRIAADHTSQSCGLPRHGRVMHVSPHVVDVDNRGLTVHSDVWRWASRTSRESAYILQRRPVFASREKPLYGAVVFSQVTRPSLRVYTLPTSRWQGERVVRKKSDLWKVRRCRHVLGLPARDRVESRPSEVLHSAHGHGPPRPNARDRQCRPQRPDFPSEQLYPSRQGSTRSAVMYPTQAVA